MLRLGGEGSDAGLTVYCRPRTRFKDDDRSGGVLGLVGGCVCGVTARSRGFWEVPTSSRSSGTRKTFLGHWGKILDLAGVVLLLDRRDERRFLFFCYMSRQTYVEVKVTYSEGGTHEEMLHPQSKAKVMNKRDERSRSQSDRLVDS